MECPDCQADIVGNRCSACGLAVKIIEIPERPCTGCGQAILLDGEAIRCGACGLLQPADPAWTLRVQASCPRCRRRLLVDDSEEATCQHCGEAFALEGTL